MADTSQFTIGTEASCSHAAAGRLRCTRAEFEKLDPAQGRDRHRDT
jgi:hypothetical protein